MPTEKRASAVDDLVRCLACPLQDAARLLADAVKRVPHRRLGRASDLELGDHAVHSLHVTIDLATVVAAHRRMERHVADIARNVAGKLYGRRELLRLFPRAFTLPLELSVALGHLRSITRLCVSRVIRR